MQRKECGLAGLVARYLANTAWMTQYAVVVSRDGGGECNVAWHKLTKTGLRMVDSGRASRILFSTEPRELWLRRRRNVRMKKEEQSRSSPESVQYAACRQRAQRVCRVKCACCEQLLCRCSRCVDRYL